MLLANIPHGNTDGDGGASASYIPSTPGVGDGSRLVQSAHGVSYGTAAGVDSNLHSFRGPVTCSCSSVLRGRFDGLAWSIRLSGLADETAFTGRVIRYIEWPTMRKRSSWFGSTIAFKECIASVRMKTDAMDILVKLCLMMNEQGWVRLKLESATEQSGVLGPTG